MSPEETTPTPPLSEHEKEVVKLIGTFLTKEEYRFQFMGDDCIELYLQGKNLIMRMLMYVHNRHLVIRVPAFLRNVELRRMDILLHLMETMNNFFDIRFELSDDGKNLSASINHILEDSSITHAQFSQCLTVVAYMVDETYPKLMKLIYGQDEPGNPQEKTGPKENPGTREKSGSGKSGQEAAVPNTGKNFKIN